MQDTRMSIKLNEIIIGTRLRKDYGNLSDLDTIEERGLIQPIVLNVNANGQHELVAGGRRHAKLLELGHEMVYHGVTCDPQRPGYVYAQELEPDVRREIELYENIGRKPMTWQERVVSIYEIHQLKMRRSALDRESWGLRETGAELGVNFAHLSRIILVAEELKNSESKIHECKGVTDAIRWLLERKEDEAKRELAKLTSKTLPKSLAEIPVAESNETLEEGEPLIVPLSKMLFQGKMEEVSVGWSDEVVDHIIADWPYAIDMSYLEQGNGMDVSRVEAEHNVEENQTMYPVWLFCMYRLLKPGGFCVLWYDNVQWELIHKSAEAVGFRVQRWPLVWIKTSPCLNQMAHKNFTKATEFAIVMSKGNAHLVKPQPVNFWAGPRASTTSNPFAKPKGLWQFIMSAICTQGETVLDPFAGEGSSTMAAIDFGLRPLAIESNENHFNQLTNNVREKYTELTKGNINFE